MSELFYDIEKGLGQIQQLVTEIMVKCPRCGQRQFSDRLERHMNRVHNKSAPNRSLGQANTNVGV